MLPAREVAQRDFCRKFVATVHEDRWETRKTEKSHRTWVRGAVVNIVYEVVSKLLSLSLSVRNVGIRRIRTCWNIKCTAILSLVSSEDHFFLSSSFFFFFNFSYGISEKINSGLLARKCEEFYLATPTGKWAVWISDTIATIDDSASIRNEAYQL